MKEEQLLHTIKVYKNYDIEKIKEEIKKLPEFSRLIYLQGDTLDMKAVTPPNFNETSDVEKRESEFNKLLFKEIPYINSIIEENNLVRTRLMIVKPGECYGWHNDNTERWHVPIISKIGAFFTYADGLIYMEADGSLYKTDTRQFHTVFNGTDTIRMHLVGAPIKNFSFTLPCNVSRDIRTKKMVTRNFRR